MKHQNLKHYLNWMLVGFGAISLSILFFFLLYQMRAVGAAFDSLVGILAPFLYGGVIAYLLRPVCNGIANKLSARFPRLKDSWINLISVTLSVLFGIFLIYALIALIVPQLYRNVVSLWATIPGKVDATLRFLEENYQDYRELIAFFDRSSESIYETVDNWIHTTITPNLNSIVSGVGMSVWRVFVFLKNVLIGVIVAVYLLANRKQFRRQANMLLRSICSPKWAGRIAEEARLIDRMFGGFISGKLLDSLIIGVLCYIGCAMFRFPNALLISVIIGVTNIIPFFGPFIGAVPSVVLILLEDPIKSIWFALFILVLQQLDGHIIGPAILGNRTGLSSFWVLFAIVVFGGLWGIVGMVIGVPLFAVIYDVVKKLVHMGLKRHAPAEAEQES